MKHYFQRSGAMFLLATTIGASGATSSQAAAPQPMPQTHIMLRGKKIPMSKADASKFKALQKAGVTVFYPTFVPPRFKLSSVQVSSENNPKEIDYVLQFSDKNKVTFNVESAADGLGDGPCGDRQLDGISRYLGKFQVYVFKPHTEGNDTPDMYYLSSWLTLNPTVPGKQLRSYHFLGNGVSDKEALAIVQSLAPVDNTR